MGERQLVKEEEEENVMKTSPRTQEIELDKWPPGSDRASSILTRPQAPRRQRSLPATPPRPSNAWILYRADIMRAIEAEQLTERQEQVRREVLYETAKKAPTATNRSGQQLGNISRIASAMWKAENATIRNLYTLRSENVRRQHRVLYPDYKFQPRRRQGKGKETADSEAASSSKVSKPRTKGKGKQKLIDDASKTEDDGSYEIQWLSTPSESVSGDFDFQAWNVDPLFEGSSYRSRSQSSPLRLGEALSSPAVSTGSTESAYQERMEVITQSMTNPLVRTTTLVPGERNGLYSGAVLEEQSNPHFVTQEDDRPHLFLPPRRSNNPPSSLSSQQSTLSNADLTPLSGQMTEAQTAFTQMSGVGSPPSDWQKAGEERGWSSAAVATSFSIPFHPQEDRWSKHMADCEEQIYSASAPAWQARFTPSQMDRHRHLLPSTDTSEWQPAQTHAVASGLPASTQFSHSYTEQALQPVHPIHTSFTSSEHHLPIEQAHSTAPDWSPATSSSIHVSDRPYVPEQHAPFPTISLQHQATLLSPQMLSPSFANEAGPSASLHDAYETSTAPSSDAGIASNEEILRRIYGTGRDS